MSALKHMEGIFAVVMVAGVVVAALPNSNAKSTAPQAAPAYPAMPVVVVKAKRMTALEKRQSARVDAAIGNAAKGT